MTTYIKRTDRQTGFTETVDEFESRTEALEMLREYKLSDPAGNYVTSRTPCEADERDQ